MVGVKALLDTNILIDYLNGIDAARTEINRYTMPCI
ncbi:MAG: VapC toxin family PIN domain ribonuclease, partial [Gammaproteobacteria bacterium]